LFYKRLLDSEIEKIVSKMERMLDLNDMAIFAAVAESESLSAAGRRLDIPKSRISRHLRRLEERLGTRLIDRTTRTLSVTEAGHALLGHCQRIVEEAEHAEISIHQLTEIPRGVLRVSVPVAFGQQVMAAHLSEFLAAYPDINLKLLLTNRRVDLISEGVDVAIRGGPLEDSSLVSRRLSSTSAKLYASRSYLSRFGSPARVNQLASHRLIAASETEMTSRWKLAGPRGADKTISFEPYASVNDVSVAQRLAEDGVGIALLPSYLAQSSKTLTPILPRWESPPISLFVLYPSRRGTTPKVRAFVDFVADRIGSAA